jgi:predicted ArsR family transcriptional regulator
MQLTRKQILEYLHNHRMATSIQLSHALQVTRANIRHHLAILEEQALVEVIGHAPQRGRGRPTKLYSLTPQALANNIENLAMALLKALLSGSSQVEMQAQIEHLASLLGGEPPSSPTTLRTRLDQAVAQLNQQAYQARWEAHVDAPHLILEHCPYAAILPKHPELCQLDAALLKRLLGQPVEQIARLERGPEGVPHCIFKLI